MSGAGRSGDDPRLTRRGLLNAAAGTLAVASAAPLVAACGSDSTRRAAQTVAATTPPPTAVDGDLPILRAALELERRAVAAYTAAIPWLTRPERHWAAAFLDHERQQADALSALIAGAGADVPGPAPSYDIGHPRGRAAILASLTALEAEQVDRYVGWIPRLSAGSVRTTVSSVMAADAQHVAALRQARGRPPLAGPFPGAAA